MNYRNAHVTEVALLRASDVTFHYKENMDAHHTRDYDMKELILRRGQPFDLTVFFNRPYDEEYDDIILQFVTGKCLSCLRVF